MYAIEHAHRICDWQENMVSEEIPPKWMWCFEEELEIWFEEVDQQRKARFGGGESRGDENVPMMQNEMTKGRRR